MRNVNRWPQTWLPMGVFATLLFACASDDAEGTTIRHGGDSAIHEDTGVDGTYAEDGGPGPDRDGDAPSTGPLQISFSNQVGGHAPPVAAVGQAPNPEPVPQSET